MSKAHVPFAWRTFMFGVPSQEAGPLALGTGTSRDDAILDAYRRMVQRRVTESAGPQRPVAEQLQAALGRLARAVTARRQAFDNWLGDTKVRTPEGEPQVVFHGTTAEFERFDTTAQRSFGAHFGTEAQALEFVTQPGGRMLPAYLSIKNPVRLKDAGSWGAYDIAEQLHRLHLISPELYAKVRVWSDETDDPGVVEGEFDPYEAMRQELQERGIDGVVYLNRGEGTGAEDRHWPTTMSDEDFLQYIPHAKDSWIAFHPEQIHRAAPQRPISPDAFSKAIEQVYRKQPFWKLMLEESRPESGPFDGGCLIVAQAMIEAAGRGELVRVASNANAAEHYGARIDGVIYDFNGAVAGPDEWVERFVRSEHARDLGRSWHFAEGYAPCEDILDDPKVSIGVAEMLREVLPALRPQLAWRPESELDLGSSLQVVHEEAGRYPAVEQMGHSYVNDQTHLVAVTLASDASLARRMQTVGFDPAKAKLVLEPAARRAASEAEIDLKMVDWSEVTAGFMAEAATEAQKALEAPAASLESLPSAAAVAPALTLVEAGEGRLIDADVLEVLCGCTVQGNLLRLPARRLDPKFYARVDFVLKGLGGRWHSKRGGHVFEDPNFNPEAILQVAIATGRFITPQDFGYFPTPADVVQRLIQLAGLRPGMKVLEPSAGRGAIALAAAEIVGKQNVTVVELLPTNAAHLARLGFHQLPIQDFLKIEPNEVLQFDRVIMNPPFSRLADVEHVMHATRFVKPDGRLLAITSPAWEHHSTKKAAAFSDFFEEVDGNRIEIPAGAFREAGTEVATRILTLEAENFPWHRRETARERQRA